MSLVPALSADNLNPHPDITVIEAVDAATAVGVRLEPEPQHGVATETSDKVQVYMKTDLTSAYLWRGGKDAGVSLQPVLGVKWKGLDLYFWGNEQLCPDKDPAKATHEVDLILKYSFAKHWMVGFKDVYVSSRGKGIFSFGHIDHAANGLDFVAAYSCKWLTVDWSTTIAGYDGYDRHGKRAYGSYISFTAPFKFQHIDWAACVGIVPYYCSRYDDDSSGFHVNEISLRASHDFNLNRRGNMSLTPYMMVMLNPSGRRCYFQVGAQWAFNP